MTQQKVAELIDVMREAYGSRQCVCRKSKEGRQPFCRRCFLLLPRFERAGLRSGDKKVMAVGYRDCVRWLEEQQILGVSTAATLFGKVKRGVPIPPGLKKSAPKKPKNRIVVFDDGREKCEGTEWDKRREECHDRAEGLCEHLIVKEGLDPTGARFYFEARCNKPAPLHETETDGGYTIKAGQAHHKRRRKERDDRLPNLLWCCWKCHDKEHVGKKPVPAKSPEVECVSV